MKSEKHILNNVKMDVSDSRICGKDNSNPLVSITIISHNGGNFILDCLRSIEKSDYYPFELFVVDNASTDGSIDAIEASFKSVRVIRLKHNMGYGAAANIGIGQTRGELVVVMNQDVFVHKGWVSHLVDAYRQYGVAIYQPKILLASNSNLINSAGNMINLAGFTVLRGAGQSSLLYNKSDVVCYASGACFMFHRSVIDAIGLFDPSYFMYKEDLDWGWRALLMGLKTYYIPSAIVYHRWNPSRNLEMKIYFSERNRIITLCKNYSKRASVLLLPYLLFIEFSTIVFCLYKGLLKQKIQAYSDIVRLISYIHKQRLLIQSRRIVPDQLIISTFSLSFYHPLTSHFSEIPNKILEKVGRVSLRLLTR